ncbi:MAG TPA: AAA family ATPase, partial [Herpetosiphonaceae bacterium]
MDYAFDWIVATKFHPPAPHSELLPRPRLAGSLADALSSRRLTILSAPAGSGKTTALAEALRGLALPTVWLALDADDNDPARFALGLLAGIGRVRPGCGDLARSLLAGLDNPAADLRRVLGVLINELLEPPAPLLLVLDDLHLIEEPAIHAGLEFLLERMPPGLRLAATTRAEPPLALARLRAQRQLAEFRLDELCFTPGETADWLNERLGLGLPAGELALVQSATAGWAAGLGLVAGSLDRRAPADERWLLDALGRAGGFMFDFLAEEVLRREDPAVRRFLLETAVLADLTPALCAAVTGRDDAGRLLETVRARNLFVAEIGGPQRVARYHPLFAGFLLAQLEREQPGRAAELRLRAAAA